MRRATGGILGALLGAAALAATTATAQEELTGEAIMRHTDRDHRARDERGVVDMILVSEDGRRQKRVLEILLQTAQDSDDDKNLLRFVEPANVRGTAVLTLEASGRADDQWLFLPALGKTKRIASSQRTQRFAGTDFTYEDLRSEDFESFEYERKGEATVRGADCYVVEATPLDGVTSGYSRREILVDRDRFLIHEIRYYDERGRHHKTLENVDFQQVDGLWRSGRSRMQDHQRGTQTLWRFNEREINPGLADSLFTVRNLERGL